MSFEERLEAASTAEDLHLVMADLREHGGIDWTFQTASNHVAPDLWHELEHYFHDDGFLLEVGAWLRAAQDPVQPSSLSEVIAAFHERLGAGAGLSQVNVGTDARPIVNAPADEVGVLGHEIPERYEAAEILKSGDVPERVAATHRYHCSICLKMVGEPLVPYRKTEVCAECKAILP